MPKTPTIPEILADFEAEIARAPRFCQVDRTLLQRLIDDHRRLEEGASADVLAKAKVGLIAALHHPFESCNPGLKERCFVCTGLRAVMEARGETVSGVVA